MTIAEFLLKLARNDELLQRFKDNPEEILRHEKDLDHEQLALLRAGRLVDLRVKITAEFEVHGETVAMHTIYMTIHRRRRRLPASRRLTPVTRGSLTVVGTGISMGVQLTPEARAAIDNSDELVHLAADPVTEEWLACLHPRSASLASAYRVGEPRAAIYERIVERMLAPVREDLRVTAAFYGHPGIFVTPSHEAIRRARAEGYVARMLPAVSAEDCLFADLGVDPAVAGCLSFDATDFLLRSRPVDTSSALILWQISVIGDLTALAEPRLDNVRVLVERLLEDYPGDHGVVVYEASPYPVAEPVIERVRLDELSRAPLTALSTLYVPPATERPSDAEMAVRLGFSTH